MEHPLMFDPDDPLLERVRVVCMAYPGAQERISHGRPNFFTVRTFCYFGGGQRRGKGDWLSHDHAILVRPDPDDEPALRADDRFFVPGSLGASGWLGIDLADAGWDEIAELIDASFRVTAPARLVTEWDASGGGRASWR
ncbi:MULTISPECIES: MmcQ/YjbR family DNA-binding protein [unclassified Microbacterium]|uniref:MmcQ/YjbR family DNA-binding protein n=1 Tax=unclassified Microbacterium TaxID=2609290 RepID=UPI00214B44D9|nr:MULTISPECIES: MmcQ/YjbR family DNA-binding protein [unclassified Microbacterium]MCR2783227.1 MmcQ/YjbR family DNA-binding protein [Microbacterium sp. zg.B96]MDL5351989.1 MmcQ/YjbR family DNA-binding protein [Microbacterium sp. zg-YB36]WIM15896.1 MmcQ/YjbR family DNA-binding protein [Microbacterium sp. zg-B96]